MGDHPPMGRAIESLSSVFGIAGSGGTVHSAKNTPVELKDSSILVFSDKNLDRKSPLITGRDSSEQVRKIMAFSGQAIIGDGGNYFLKLGEDSIYKNLKGGDGSAKGWAIGVSKKVKKGRVVVYGDASVFTSKIEDTSQQRMGISRPGIDNVQLALNTFHWLSGLTDH